MTLENNKALAAQFVAVINGRDFTLLDQLLADDFSIPPKSPSGLSRDGLKKVLEYYVSAFPDLRYAIEEQVAEGDTVVVHLTMRGTHEGNYQSHPGTGKTFEVDEVDILHIVDGKIAGDLIVWDEKGFTRQLGFA
jgi:steroid delta-isomerase-like uncharacterized protein